MVSFEKIFSNYIEYEIEKNCLILIILIENYSNNSYINNLNYYFYALNENNDNLKNQIAINDKNFDLINQKLQIICPINKESTKKNGENYISSFNQVNKYYSNNIDLLNINDSFYNDICSKFTSNVNTDMTLNDRRNEYFINICEYNCNLVEIKNIGLAKLKAVCICNIKEKYILNNELKNEENIEQIKTLNAEVIKCWKKLFEDNSLKSNINFWFFLIILLFQIFFSFNACCKGKKQVYKILGIKNKEKNISIQNEYNNNNPPPRRTLTAALRNKNRRDEENNSNDNENNQISNIRRNDDYNYDSRSRSKFSGNNNSGINNKENKAKKRV